MVDIEHKKGLVRRAEEQPGWNQGSSVSAEMEKENNLNQPVPEQALRSEMRKDQKRNLNSYKNTGSNTENPLQKWEVFW